jgi:hypothetical protein
MDILPFISSNLPRGLKGGCSDRLFEMLEDTGLEALMLMLPFSLVALLFVSVIGFWAAGRISCGYYWAQEPAGMLPSSPFNQYSPE